MPAAFPYVLSVNHCIGSLVSLISLPPLHFDLLSASRVNPPQLIRLILQESDDRDVLARGESDDGKPGVVEL